MPNHVTHRVVVRGPQASLKKFREEHIIQTQEQGEVETQLDFNRVIPMPEALQGSESGGHSSMGALVWFDMRDNPFGPQNWEEMVEQYQWIPKHIKTREALKEFLKRKYPGIEAAALRYKHNVEAYGFPSWYEWSVERWGTKWNSYDFHWERKDQNELEFTFQTAWSPPIPIFQELVRMFPDLEFHVKSFDEGWNYACEGYFKKGDETYTEIESGDKATMRRLYEEVYGEPPEEETEEEESEEEA